MPDNKILQLTDASTPLAGNELLSIAWDEATNKAFVQMSLFCGI